MYYKADKNVFTSVHTTGTKCYIVESPVIENQLIWKCGRGVNHFDLVAKLNAYGLREPLLGWLRSYLPNRRLIVDFAGTTPAPVLASSNVPQGSSLNANVSLFADNVKVVPMRQTSTTSITRKSIIGRLEQLEVRFNLPPPWLTGVIWMSSSFCTSRSSPRLIVRIYLPRYILHAPLAPVGSNTSRGVIALHSTCIIPPSLGFINSTMRPSSLTPN
ncbi:hypothetical protein J6590_074643 [Homalodisca vitripennis]|nr:hypothetical protein J6590_074643 [Homalodisca vitripennis]